MSLVFLALGSNCGDRIFYLEKSIEEINHQIGVVMARSAIYETEPWGFEGQNFLNMVVKVQTHFTALEILNTIKHIEQGLGRQRTPGKYTDRTIDLDILFYDAEIVSTGELIIPHPRLHERLFALEPMMDLAPELNHPVLNKTIRQLREACRDKGWIRKIPNT